MTVSVSPSTENYTAATYTLTFVASDGISTGGSATPNSWNLGSAIKIVAPNGTNFTSVRGVDLTDQTNPADSQHGIYMSADSSAPNTAYLDLNSNIGAGDSVVVQFNGVTNPGTASSNYTWSVATDVDQTPATSAPYSIGYGSVSGLNVSLDNTNPASSGVSYQINFVATDGVSSSGLATPSSWALGSAIKIVAPNGTDFSNARNASLTDQTNSADSQSSVLVDTGNAPNIAYVSLQSDIPAGNSISLVIQGVSDPSTSGSYTLTLATDVDQATAMSAPYAIVTQKTCPTATGGSLPGAVGIAAVSVGGCPGYYVVDASGDVSAFGSAVSHGQLGSPGANIVGMVAESDGSGYWLVGAAGAVFAYGSAGYYGGANNINLAAPVLGMSVTQDGKGYWLVAADGGIFSYGDAHFYGSMGGRYLAKPVDGMAAAPGGNGYWLVAADGGVFAFTSDGFYGSMGGKPLNQPVIGMSGTPDGRGYTLVASDGGVFNFGDSTFYGSLGGNPPSSPVVDLSPGPGNNGYYLVDSAGDVFAFGPGAKYFGGV